MVRLGVDKTDCSSITIGSGKNRACVVYAYGPDGKVIYEEITFFPDLYGANPREIVFESGREDFIGVPLTRGRRLWWRLFGK